MKRKYEIKKIHKKSLMVGMIVLLLGSHCLIFGCSGATIREDRRIPLVANQPYEGVSKTGHYILEYSFTFHPKATDETGSMEFTGNLKPTRPLETLSIRLQFLDSEGKVIDMQPIYGSGFRGGAGKATIQKRFETPPGTVAIAFTHYAAVRSIKP
jgi:hypothetical protein